MGCSTHWSQAKRGRGDLQVTHGDGSGAPAAPGAPAASVEGTLLSTDSDYVIGSEHSQLEGAPIAPALASPAPAAKTPISSPSSAAAPLGKRIKSEHGQDLSDKVSQVLQVFSTTMAQKEHQRQVDEDDRQERRLLERRLFEAKIKTEEEKQAAARAASTRCQCISVQHVL